MRAKKTLAAVALIAVIIVGTITYFSLGSTELEGTQTVIEDTSDVEVVEDEGEENQESSTSGVLDTQEVLDDGFIGFIVDASGSWGEFVATLYKRSFSNNPGLGEDWEYRGSFAGWSDVGYYATDPEHVVAREGWVGDVLGYEKKEDGYYVNVMGRGADTKVPDTFIVEDVDMINGTALLVYGPEESDGPSFFPNRPGQMVAYINTPNGPLVGGVFVANLHDEVVTTEQFKEMLASVSIQ